MLASLDVWAWRRHHFQKNTTAGFARVEYGFMVTPCSKVNDNVKTKIRNTHKMVNNEHIRFCSPDLINVYDIRTSNRISRADMSAVALRSMPAKLTSTLAA